MMGSGKTSVGQLLSKYLKSTFYDLDSGIEKRFNLTITEIFNEYGEDRFREAESSLLFETNNLENCVISTGGGIVINDTNRNFLRDQRVYYLNNSVETLYERAAKKRKQRPLMKNLTQNEFNLMYENRVKLYQELSLIHISEPTRLV